MEDFLENGDQHRALMSVCLTGGESYILSNNVVTYYQQLEKALSDIKNDTKCDYLCFSFIALASATLEYSLNYMLAVYCFHKFEVPEYKRYLDIYKNIRFKEKLFILPHIISDGKYVINEDSHNIKALYELIKLRNKLLHNSEYIQTFEFPDIGVSIMDDGIFVPIENEKVEFNIHIEDNVINTITPKLCIRIGDALLEFNRIFMTPFTNRANIEENEMVHKIVVKRE